MTKKINLFSSFASIPSIIKRQDLNPKPPICKLTLTTRLGTVPRQCFLILFEESRDCRTPYIDYHRKIKALGFITSKKQEVNSSHGLFRGPVKKIVLRLFIIA